MKIYAIFNLYILFNILNFYYLELQFKYITILNQILLYLTNICILILHKNIFIFNQKFNKI